MHASKEQASTLKIIEKRADFVKINQKCRKWTSHGLILQVLANETGEKRIGFTITKKTEPSAVKRNRIKRRLRAVAADILPKNAKNGHDYVLIGRSQTATRPYASLCNDLTWCLDKMGMRENGDV